MSLRRILLSIDAAELTNVDKFPVGTLPARLTNGVAPDLTIVPSGLPWLGAVFDPDGVHVWCVASGEIRQARISDGATINQNLVLAARIGIDKVDANAFYVRDDTSGAPIIKVTFGGATPTMENFGTLKPAGDTNPSGNPCSTGNKVWFIHHSREISEFDLAAGDPGPILRSVPLPFNTDLDVGVRSRLYADSTHLYFYWYDYGVVHRWRLSDLRYEGYHRSPGVANIDKVLGLYLPDDGTCKIVRGSYASPDTGPPVDVWAPIEQDTADVFTGAGLPAAIPDDDSNGVDINVVVNGVGIIDGVAVTVDIAHTYIGDLHITVTDPNGTTTKKIWGNIVAGNEDGLKIELADVSPTFRGLSADGTWQVNIADAVASDTGSVTDVKLYFGNGGLVEKSEFRDPTAAQTNAIRLPPYDTNGVGLEVWPDQQGNVRVVGNTLFATPGDAQWSYDVPSARIFRGVVLVGDLSRESTDAAEAHKTKIFYHVGTEPPGAWTNEIRPGEDPAVAVDGGQTIYIKVDLDPDGGDQPWISEAALLLDDQGNTGFEGQVEIELHPEGEITL